MRDTTIHAMHQATGRREGLILAQFEFLKTRQEALETVLAASGWTDRVRWMLRPASFLAEVNDVQESLLLQAQKDMQAAAEAARKPKIEVVPAGVLGG